MVIVMIDIVMVKIVMIKMMITRHKPLPGFCPP